MSNFNVISAQTVTAQGERSSELDEKLAKNTKLARGTIETTPGAHIG